MNTINANDIDTAKRLRELVGLANTLAVTAANVNRMIITLQMGLMDALNDLATERAMSLLGNAWNNATDEG